MIKENIVIVLDRKLLPHFECSTWPTNSPSLLETELTILTASHPSQLLCELESPIAGISLPFVTEPEQSGHQLLPAFKHYTTLRSKWPDTHKYRDLIIIATCSENSDVSILDAFGWLKEQRLGLLGIALFDLGGYVCRKDNAAIKEYVDLVVQNRGDTIRRTDLVSLWEWLPECLSGFRMYYFEGHHPGEPTWLKYPPDPFIGEDYVQPRKDSFGKGDTTKCDGYQYI